jgi:uncharacterized protein (TIGR03067 family)
MGRTDVRSIVPAIVAVGLLIGADEPGKGGAKKDAEALQGTWKMVSLTIDGEGATERVSSSKLVVAGDRFTPTVDGQAIPCTFTLDPSAKPKAIDLTYTSGDLKGRTVKGIYKFDGDTFVMCRTLRPDDDRPEHFSSESGSKLVLVIWERSKPSARGDGP